MTLTSTLASDSRSSFGDVGFVDADFSAVPLTVGQKYTVEITVPAGNLPSAGTDTGFGVWTSLSNPYSGGRFFFPAGYDNAFFSDEEKTCSFAPARPPAASKITATERSRIHRQA